MLYSNSPLTNPHLCFLQFICYLPPPPPPNSPHGFLKPQSPHPSWTQTLTVIPHCLQSRCRSGIQGPSQQCPCLSCHTSPHCPVYRTGYIICGWGLGQNENVESHCKNLFRCSRQQQQHIRPSMAGPCECQVLCLGTGLPLHVASVLAR